eukprot:TRINITY_DN8040_c0_g1_i1.p1 TRINITY_DN8040_c0_g1~~TRINITY_DN8040_c0_g1_i1.p1  ORF type:complete len:433 (+),score=82.04 TRINITY_DN8040_c0_g1_i1:80-1378(+)
MNRPYTHRGAPLMPQRISELMDGLKAEYEAVSRNANVFKMERDDFERKLQQQIQESQSIQQQIYELDRNQQKMKQKYEEEILHLRRQLGQVGESMARQSIAGDKRSPSAELSSAQELTNIGKRHRELPSPLNSLANDNSNGMIPSLQGERHMREKGPVSDISEGIPSMSNTLSLSQIAKQAQAPKRVASDTKLPPNGQGPAKRQRTSPEPSETEGPDWAAGYNPGVPKKLDVKLDHDMEHDSVVCCVNFSADGKYLVTGCNHSAQIFDVKTGQKIHTYREKVESNADLYIRSVCFSPDGKTLATGAEDKTVKLWEVDTQNVAHVLTGHDLDIYSLAFTPDGRYVISGSGDKRIKVWRVEDAKCQWTLGDDNLGPTDGVTSVAISPDGHTVASGSLDRIIRLWDIETGAFLGHYEGHADSVYSSKYIFFEILF